MAAEGGAVAEAVEQLAAGAGAPEQQAAGGTEGAAAAAAAAPGVGGGSPPAKAAASTPGSSAKKAGPGRPKKAKDGAPASSKKSQSSPAASGMRGISSFLVRAPARPSLTALARGRPRAARAPPRAACPPAAPPRPAPLPAPGAPGRGRRPRAQGARAGAVALRPAAHRIVVGRCPWAKRPSQMSRAPRRQKQALQSKRRLPQATSRWQPRTRPRRLHHRARPRRGRLAPCRRTL